VLIVLAIAAAEVAIGLGLAILVFRRFGTINLTQLRQFSG
jgi:NADH:ubiquinone oxidoreductase subunit K